MTTRHSASTPAPSRDEAPEADARWADDFDPAPKGEPQEEDDPPPTGDGGDPYPVPGAGRH